VLIAKTKKLIGKFQGISFSVAFDGYSIETDPISPIVFLEVQLAFQAFKDELCNQVLKQSPPRAGKAPLQSVKN
jgi:hypothetical protein